METYYTVGRIQTFEKLSEFKSEMTSAEGMTLAVLTQQLEFLVRNDMHVVSALPTTDTTLFCFCNLTSY
jgi:hypothetical protein